MIQQTESSACVSIFIRGCLVSNREPRMGSFNHCWAARHRLYLDFQCFTYCQHLPGFSLHFFFILLFFPPTGRVIKNHITDDRRAAITIQRWINWAKHSSFYSYRLLRARLRFYLPMNQHRLIVKSVLYFVLKHFSSLYHYVLSMFFWFLLRAFSLHCLCLDDE